jgi:hypothetical protein
VVEFLAIRSMREKKKKKKNKRKKRDNDESMRYKMTENSGNLLSPSHLEQDIDTYFPVVAASTSRILFPQPWR